ncbi:MAG: pseudouridine synthase [Mariprofundaceae bacterium]|nr:pseudouridine synthase [Mariprofundaceae bacterium]
MTTTKSNQAPRKKTKTKGRRSTAVKTTPRRHSNSASPATQDASKQQEQGTPGSAAPAAEGERLNRYLAKSGLCSRREADKRIAAGLISINGDTVSDMGRRVQPGDTVLADGKPVAPLTSHSYVLYNKPAGQLCTRRDDRGRDLIYNHLRVAPNVQSVGRLDMDTEGLLLLTDDGGLANLLTRPGSKVDREYRVRLAGNLALDSLEALRRGGLDIGDGEKSDPWDVTVDSETRGHCWLTVVVRRGRNREVRRTLEAAGHTVRRLMRIRFASLKLEEGMPRGAWRNLEAGEIRQLRSMVGLK